MDWTQALTIIISVFGLFLVAIPYLISKLEANQKENNTRFNSLENRMTSLEAESKNTSQRITDLKTDMNQRLSNIETENKDISKRLSSIEGYLAPKKVFHFEEHHREDEEPKEN